MIRISLVDDHKLFRSGIRALLSAHNNFEVVSESDNGKEFTETVDQVKPDVVLMDLEMPEMDGMETTKYLKEHHPDVKVIVISMHNDEKFIVHLMEIGARGYLLKNADPDDIISAIHSVNETGYFFTELVSRVMLHGLVKGEKVKPSFLPGNDLTSREIEVLKLICQEFTAAEIGEKLFISPRTVEGHRNNLLLKIGARNIAGIVVFAMKHGFYE
ncbi:MAG: DNA-binding response regulator [Cryomorphaceae bacterium]|nr:MAG: DNA-binding response regulator [Cryomorphaceae bacterium]